MRNKKLITKHSTKAERVFGERLKTAQIPFKTKVRVGPYEVDFVIGKYAIEIDGHGQCGIRNRVLLEYGFTPIHLANNSVKTVNILFYGQSSRRN